MGFAGVAAGGGDWACRVEWARRRPAEARAMRGEGMRGENMGFVWVLCGFGWVGVDGGSLGNERERAAGGLEPRKMRRFTGGEQG